MTGDAPTTSRCGHWRSPLDAARVFSRSETIGYLRPAPGKGYWFLRSQPEESNAQALMYLNDRQEIRRVSPAGFNLRSRVHEYGGLPFAAMKEHVYYVNFRDQRLYRQAFNTEAMETGEPVPLTPESGADPALRYLEPEPDPRRNRLLVLREDHRDPEHVRNTLVSVDAETGGEGLVVFDDSDFVSSPRLSPDGRLLVFLAWNHPDMPWDRTTLCIADMNRHGMPERLRRLHGQDDTALMQPLFADNGDLYLLSDRDGFWNPWRVTHDSLQEDRPSAEPMFRLPADCGSPPWQAGNRQMAVMDPHRLVVTVLRNGLSDLVLFDTRDGSQRNLLTGLGQVETVLFRDGAVSAIIASRYDTPAIISLDPLDDPPDLVVLLQCHSDARLPREAVSTGQPVRFPAGDQEEAYGILYAPDNPDYHPMKGEKPPLIVAVHGGPTGCARTAYNPAIQFWTSRGFAFFDVNHRGSTGFGRDFRRALYGQWGVVDVEDIIRGVEWLIAEGRVDPRRIAIRGGSAGGYAVLSALIHSDLFSAGVSYYGVSDLSLLAADTHKFESRYLDQLIGPWPQAEHRYRERSPVHHIDRIDAPVLLLQGSEDRVVPPNQAEAIFDRLKARNPASDYIVFEGEGHGFRAPENQIHALESELAFYHRVLWKTR